MRKRKYLKRWTALLCALLILFTAPGASAFFEEALNKLVNWNVMRGDSSGNLREEDPITRAEFVAMVNRAYGYTETCDIDFFIDVLPSDWYYNDIAIAYNAGYFKGTSEVTAGPNDSMTREQALTMLARNMRLDLNDGLSLDFSDSNEFSSYSRSYVAAAVQCQLVQGYSDGSFRPKNLMTRGATAQILANAIGTLVNESSDQSLGDVYGNVTISTSGVTLRDTTIAGNLYVSGGLDLGAVTLDNVSILGDIIVAGCGESEGGENSVVLRNVVSPSLLVDTIGGQYVSVGVEGDTTIPVATLRCDAYIQDRTPSGQGLQTIYLESDVENRKYSLSGNLETIFNLAPNSSVTIGQGTVESLTMDEKSASSSLTVDMNATIRNLNLDTGSTVSGDGDIETLTVNTEGSTSTILPDNVTIRPGVTSTIAGETLNSTTAQESSTDPRLLSGYPAASDIAPTSLNAAFAGNKAGTVYWAVSAVSDGSVDADELLSPSSYGSIAIQHGTVTLTASNTPVGTKIDKLTKGGSYYLSALLVDSRGKQSPVKVISFSTPDNTVPAFATGYPTVSKVTAASAQASVMSTKDCILYYVVYPKNSTAPTGNDLKTASVDGNLGYGSRVLTRNVPDYFTVNDQALTEMTSYDLYLWLTDADGGQSSAVTKLTFTTSDETSPVFLTDMEITSTKITSVTAAGNLDEDATIYWVVTAEDTKYPKSPTGTNAFTDYDDETKYAEFLKTEYAKFQVASGLNALKNGKVTAKANTDATISITGLTKETSYKLYYVAVDAAGNYSESVKWLSFRTLDTTAPTVTQKFTKFPDDSTEDGLTPYSDTDIKLIFSEQILQNTTQESLYELYQNHVAANDISSSATTIMQKALRECIELYNGASNADSNNRVTERTWSTADTTQEWVIDYRFVTMEYSSGQLTITFSKDNGSLNLKSGATYRFFFRDLADSSGNLMSTNNATLPAFTTIYAQVSIASNPSGITNTYLNPNGDGTYTQSRTSSGSNSLAIDMSFSLKPNGASRVDENIVWDVLLFSDITCEYELYYRTVSTSGSTATSWRRLESASKDTLSVTVSGSTQVAGSRNYLRYFTDPFPYVLDSTDPLTDNYEYQYVIHFKRIGNSSDRTSWTQTVTFEVHVLCGYGDAIQNLAWTQGGVTKANLNAAVNATSASLKVNEIGISSLDSSQRYAELVTKFVDTSTPKFVGGYPNISNASSSNSRESSVTINLMLDNNATVYYVITEVNDINTLADVTLYTYDSGTGEYSRAGEFNAVTYFTCVPTIDGSDAESQYYVKDGDNYVPVGKYYSTDAAGNPFYLTTPESDTFQGDSFEDFYSEYIHGKETVKRNNKGSIAVDGLKPETQYYIYFVTQNESGQAYSNVQLFRFTTPRFNADPPILTINSDASSITIKSSRSQDVDIWGILVATDGATYRTIFNNRLPATVGNMSTADSLNVDNRTSTNSRTQFDLYAEENVKETLRNVILETQASGADTVRVDQDQKPIELRATNNYTITIPLEVQLLTSYTLLVMATSDTGLTVSDITNNGALSLDYVSFAAYTLRATGDGASPYVLYIEKSNLKVSEENSTVSGTFSLIFNEMLYVRTASSATPVPLDNPPLMGGSADGYLAISQFISSSSENTYQLNTGTAGSNINALEFTLTGFSGSGSITFNNKDTDKDYLLCDEYGNWRRFPLTVVVSFTGRDTNEDGVINYEDVSVVLNPASYKWDEPVVNN